MTMAITCSAKQGSLFSSLSLDQKIGWQNESKGRKQEMEGRKGDRDLFSIVIIVSCVYMPLSLCFYPMLCYLE